MVQSEGHELVCHELDRLTSSVTRVDLGLFGKDGVHLVRVLRPILHVWSSRSAASRLALVRFTAGLLFGKRRAQSRTSEMRAVNYDHD